MKKYFFPLIISVIFTLPSAAQTLKVTAVNTSNSSEYQKAAKYLGKSITLTFYDNSVTVKMEGDSQPINLKKGRDDHYGTSKEYAAHTDYIGLKVEKVLGVVHEIKLEIQKVRSRGTNETKTYTAKRF
ncbi:MAG TPA: hypothetical protein VGB63_14625 [Pedobacter sp.]|jgi:hypothetical protein